MEIFEVSKHVTAEEKYSLTDQIRRSARSVCTNLSEAFRKRKYPAHFVSKLSDSDAENAETETWLMFSLACGYIDQELSETLIERSLEIGRLLGYMIDHPEKFR